MSSRFDNEAARRAALDGLRGLGERSSRKSYYPALQERIAELERFRTLLDESGEAIFLLEWPTAIIIDANEPAGRALGRPLGELVGTRLEAHLAPEAAVLLAEAAARAQPNGPPLSLQLGLRRADGSPYPVEVGLRLVQRGKASHLVAVARDVTEREQLRRRLAMADRMASVGTLAAGVAHEINNPLTYVLGNLDHVRRELSRLRRALAAPGGQRPARPLQADLADAEAALAEALDGAQKVRQIVRDLKMLSRPGDDERGRLDVRRLVDAAAGMVGHEIRQRAQLVKEYRASPVVVANEGRLAQVLLNLLMNAAQAIPEGQVTRQEIRLVVGGTEREVVIEVHDTGRGIKPEHLGQIFDPFFTTKPVGVGTGLGLSICHGLVTALGGRIEVESEPGRGSTFRVCLPAAPPEPAAPATSAEAAPPQALRARILVVDDDPHCGQVLERLLAGEHEVTACTSAREALELLRGQGRFDAILCDVMMPGLDGQGFYEELGEVAPALQTRVVFMTGGAFTERTQAFLRTVHNPTLEKPLVLPALRAAIELALGR